MKKAIDSNHIRKPYILKMTDMKKTVILSIFIIASSMISAQDFAKQVDMNNEFCFDFYSYVSDTDENLFISPFSVSTALAMTYEGATNKTREEMAKVMHFASDNDASNKSFKEIISRVKSSKDAEHYTLTIANSIWAQNDFEFLQSFFHAMENYFEAPLETVDFKDEKNREKALKMINEWTAKKTNDKILDLLDQTSLDKDTKMVLVNAVYFLAEWKKAFKTKFTENDTFFGINGESEREFMKQTARFAYAEHDSVQLLEIPYQDDKASMLVFLPNKTEQFTDLQNKFNLAYYNSFVDSAKFRNVELYLPKFKIEYKSDLKPILFEAGMKRAFSDKAEFFGMCCKDKEKVKIDKVIHQTFINVDESGTEAAAATAVVMKRVTSVNPDDKVVFRADRPFIFLIRENTTGSILFTGHLVN
jgi:serpin B